jgi:hypothetical protein
MKLLLRMLMAALLVASGNAQAASKKAPSDQGGDPALHQQIGLSTRFSQVEGRMDHLEKKLDKILSMMKDLNLVKAEL